MRDPHSDLFAALAAPFRGGEIKIRNQSGRSLEYITARTVMNRLDDVVGPSCWWDDYTPMESAVVCRLTILLPDGGSVTKTDAGGFTTTADSSDYEKSGFSDAFKRAAVKFGIGRYLYGDGVPDYGTTHAIAAAPAPAPAPRLAERDAERPDAPSRPAVTGTPRSGKAFFLWCKNNDCLQLAEALGRAAGLPSRIVLWDAESAAAIHRAVHADFERNRRPGGRMASA